MQMSLDDYIGMAVPSLINDNWENVFMKKFLPSMVHISNVNNLCWLFNFQPYNGNRISADNLKKIIFTLRKLNSTWKVLYSEKEFESPVNCALIRNTAASLKTDCWLYCLVDDDFVFHEGAGDCYNEIIKFFKEDEKLGLVMSAGYLGGYHYKHKLRYSRDKWYWTNRGLFFRNIRDEINSEYIFLAPDVPIVGWGFEEVLITTELSLRGYKLATHFNNPTSHKASTAWKDDEKDANSGGEPTLHPELAEYWRNKFGYKGNLRISGDIRKMMREVF